MVDEGFTANDVPLTAPIPELMDRLGEPVTAQLSVLDCPGVTVAGVAVKPVMVGWLPTVTEVAAVAEPKGLVAVRV